MIKIVARKIESDTALRVVHGIYKNGFYLIFSSMSGVKNIDVAEFYNSRDSASILSSKYNANPSDLFALIHKTDAVFFAVFLKPVDVSEFDVADVIEEPEHRSVLQSFVSHFSEYAPDAAQQCRVLMAKRNILHDVNPTDSLASLEVQVDLLTTALMDLMRKQPPEERPEWFDTVDTAFKQNSTLTLKPLGDLLADVIQQKAFVRGKQAEYFSVKYGAPDAS